MRPKSTLMTNTARFWIKPQPNCAVTGAIRPNTPIGAVHRIHQTSLINASLTASENSRRVLRTASRNVPATAPNRVAVNSRTSTDSKFLVLRIPCAYGYMGTTAYYPNGATYSVSNHPTLGDTDDLW